MSDAFSLFDDQGQRLYLTGEEREAFFKASQKASREVRTFCGVLYYTGCRITEALSLTVKQVDFSDRTLIFATLKKRKPGQYRAVPVPPEFLDTLDMVHGLKEKQASKKPIDQEQRIWPVSRATGWRMIKAVMEEAGIQDGAHKMPKGLRHAYGIHALNKGIPLNLLSKWMGHATMEVTAIYANAVGEEQKSIASRMW